jgi:bifunctional oligoribonuclease and PAP phosphatase NrnA
MFYKESKEVLKEIQKAKRIAMFCHESPDIDSIISCLLLRKILLKMNKTADIYSVDKLTHQNKLLDPENLIVNADPNKIDLSQYDILFALDVSEIRRLGFSKGIGFSGKIIRLDHHETIDPTDITIFERDAGSTSSILFYLSKDWGINLDENDFNNVLLSIISDTDTFHYNYPGSKIFQRTAELIDLGADFDKALYFVERTVDLEVMKFWAEGIKRIKIDKEGGFAYTVLPYSIIKKYENFDVRTRQLSDHFLRNISSTDFGMVFMEDKDGHTRISIRSRTPGFYVFDLITKLGGGGHLTGGGIGIHDLPFKKAIQKVLKEARRYAKESNKTE